MGDISSTLVIVMAAIVMWIHALAPFDLRRRRLLMLPFACGAVLFCFWRIPTKSGLEIPMALLGAAAAVCVIAGALAYFRRLDREREKAEQDG